MFARNVLAAVIATGVLTGSGHESAAARAAAKRGADRPYQVYLLKGLADIFSTGMDFLQAKLQARGVVGEVHSHSVVESLARVGRSLSLGIRWARIPRS